VSDARERFAAWTVVEVADGYGPSTLAAKLLADLGCPVLKLEDRDGDSLRGPGGETGLSLFELVNGSKASVRVDFAHRHAAEVVDRLLGVATIVVADGPGAAKLDALLPPSIEQRYPDLTVAVLTPFGERGTLASWRAGEEGIQAMSGIMSTTHHPGGRPVRVAGAIATHTAAMHAVTSILAHLHARRSGARGGRLSIATFDAAISMLTSAFPAFFLTGRSPPGIGNRHSMAAPWNTYRCRDGWVVICAGNEPTWQRLVQALGREDLRGDPRYATQEARVQNVDALDAEVSAWTRTRAVAEVESALDRRGIPSGPILPLAEVLAHAQFATRSLLVRDGGTAVAGGVFHRDRAPLAVRAGEHRLGEASRAALVDRAGVDPAQVERWMHEGALLARGGAHVAAA